MTPVLIDTGCIVALLDRSARQHRQCVEAISSLDAPLITCEAVITECCYLVRNLAGAQSAILDNVDRGVFLVPYRLAGNAAAVSKLMDKYADVPMAFADACLVHMADTFKTGRVLTLDRDFAIYRWQRNRRFDMFLQMGAA